MAFISNQEIVNFFETVRPIAERMRQLDEDIAAARSVWFASISGHADWTGAAGADIIADQNSAIRPLTKDDGTNLMTQMINLWDEFEAVGHRDQVLKANVRFIE